MPVNIPHELPARSILEEENIFVMSEQLAAHQDIRPLRIAILNLMPTKIQTETQLLRLLSNTPLQVEITLLHMDTHQSMNKNTPQEHLETFYQTFDQVRDRYFDGLVITGAPVEQLDFEQVDYWSELVKVMAWAKTHVFSTLHVCWAAQAGLHWHFGIPKHTLDKKVFGVFAHQILDEQDPLVRGFDEVFLAPHSRHTEVRREDVASVEGLKILAESAEAGILLASADEGRLVFVTGHPEYDRLTLKSEYDRDVANGSRIEVPRGYFPNDDPSRLPPLTWRSHAHLLYANWLNYCVYQRTPFNLDAMAPQPR
nr:homoserine O-succinyltransferase [uncultured Holophaga sp.]